MHEFDDAGMFAFHAHDDLADHVIADPYDDTTVSDGGEDDVLVDPVGPHTADHSSNHEVDESSAVQSNSNGASSDDPLLTGNPALDIDLSDAGPDLDEPGPGETDTQQSSATSGSVDEAGVHGNPVQWTINWFYQQLDGYCGPAVVGQLVAEYTGANITDPQHLIDRAIELGLLSADDPTAGMTLPDIERLLEDQGVPASISSGSLDDLRTSLDDGHAVIAMVDSGEIWQPERESVEDDTPDHVLVVAGIDDERGVVILSDPGVPNGSQLEIPIEQFEQAWADSGHQMLVTDQPDPDLIPSAPPAPNTPTADSTVTSTSASSTAAGPSSTRTTVISLRS